MDPMIRVEKEINPKSPILLATWPGMGNVAYGAGLYIKENLENIKIAEIKPEYFFYRTGVQIKNGIVEIPQLPKSEFFYYQNKYGPRDLILFIGESQPVLEKEYDLAIKVVELARYYSVSEIVTFAATPVNISHKAIPGVWGVTTDPLTLREFPSLGVNVMNTGHIGGLNGLILGVGKDYAIKGTCFLGEIPFYTVKIENPKASLAILKVFIRYSGISFDLNGLVQMARFVEEEIDKVSKSTKQTLFGEDIIPEVGAKEDEISEKEGLDREEIVVPPEIRNKIEYMFEMASKDISRAGELKKELDKWGLFQEYEDRFLDLFGKKRM